MKKLVVAIAAMCLSPIAWGQAAPPPPQTSSTQSIGKPHVCLQDYPIEAIVAGEQGTTTIGYRITTAGTVVGLHIVEPSGSKVLDDAAMTCAETWRYKPAIKDGQPIEVPWKAQVRWVLHLPPPDPAATAVFRACAATNMPLPAALKPDSYTEVLLTISGTVVTNARIRHASGDAALDARALNCAKNDWVGQPGAGFQVLSVTWSEVLPHAK